MRGCEHGEDDAEHDRRGASTDRLTLALDGANNATSYGYTELGCGCSEGERVTSVHTPDLPQNKQWSLEYGPEGRVTKVTDPDGNARSIAYTPTGEVAQSTDALSRSSTFTYDALGRGLTMTDPLLRAHAYAHPTPANGAWSGVRVLAGSADGTAPPTGVGDALANGQYQVGLGYFQQRGDPPQMEYYRDATFERGLVMKWDAQRRLTSRVDSSLPIAQLAPPGPPVASSDTNELYTYAHGRAAPLATLVSSTNKGGNTYESDNVTLDPWYETSSAQGWAGGYPWTDETVTRDPAGRVAKVAHAFKVALNGPIPSTAFTATPSQYTYDAHGYVASVTNADGAHTLGYDNRGLLASITIPNEGTYSFTYDAAGRSKELVYPDGHKRVQEYDAQGRITSRCYTYAQPNLDRCYRATQYDADGNPLVLTDPEGADNFTYDALNRLVQNRRTVGQVDSYEDYAYNALGALKKNAGLLLDDQRPKLSGGGTADAAVPASYNNLPVTLDTGGRITSLNGIAAMTRAPAPCFTPTRRIPRGFENPGSDPDFSV